MPLIFGDDKMAVFSIVKLSELEGAKRIDAEYYDPVFYSLKALYKFNVKKLNAISDIAYGTTPPGGIFEEKGIPFIRSQNFALGMVNELEVVFCKNDFHKQNKKSAICPGDILFAAVGATIGQVAIVQDSIKEGNINQNIARVRILDSCINPYYAGLFFLSKYGQLQIFRFVTGNAQTYLNSFQIGSFKIPVISKQIQDELGSCFKKIEDFVKNSQSLYSQAENLLLEELGLKDYKPKYEKTYTAKLSDAFSAHRIDAEYFQPAYEEVIEKIKKKTELKPLGKLAERIKLKHKPEENKIYKYIEISDVSIDIGEVNYTERLGKELPPNARILVKGGELIVSKVRPTRGAIGIIPIESKNNLICSSAFSVFNVDSPLKEYLYIVIRSIIGKLQLEKPTKGTSYPTIEDRDVEKLKIPILPLSTQQKIAELVKQSHESRKKAKELLDVAKRAVEIAIEKDEGEALDYIYKKTAGNSIE
jgi:restriction endonuclease S subunit